MARSQSLILFIDSKVLVTSDSTIETLYNRYAAADGFLYILCTDHETFGCFV